MAPAAPRRPPADPPVRLALRVKPGAARASVGGSYGDTGALVVAVTERAVDGRATAAALLALARALGVPKAAVTLVSGATSRDKVVQVTDPPADLAERIRALRERVNQPTTGIRSGTLGRVSRSAQCPRGKDLCHSVISAGVGRAPISRVTRYAEWVNSAPPRRTARSPAGPPRRDARPRR